MFDRKKALMSVRLIRAAQGNVTVLTGDERQNLVDMIDDSIEANGWTREQLETEERIKLN